MSSPARNYDKYTYALKRKPEKDTPSPKGSSKNLKQGLAPEHDGLAPLTMNRDGFAVAEDGSLQSRVVSPPMPKVGYSAVNTSYGSPTFAKGPNSTQQKPSPVDGWDKLVKAAANEISEEELVLLQWDTLSGLLTHYKITNPVEIARAQLVWKRKQEGIFNAEEDSNAELPREGSTRLPTQPVECIAYGRPASPRHGNAKQYVPPHKKPLSWKGQSKVDCGQTVNHPSSRQ